jgi:serine acetyltransferase
VVNYPLACVILIVRVFGSVEVGQHLHYGCILGSRLSLPFAHGHVLLWLLFG